jgi:cytochrome c oxidase assembly protein subunit 15
MLFRLVAPPRRLVTPLRRLVTPLRRPVVLRRLALGAVITNVGIVITGGAVRLTGSGMGCPTWPDCRPGSLVVRPELGGHGYVEFGNRTLTFLVALVALLGLVSALLQRHARLRAALVFAGIPAQAVLGGLTVLTHLNPWLVAAHFLLSMAVIAAAYAFWRAVTPLDRHPVGRGPRRLAWALVVVCAAVLALGTVVTGSGPHAGDVNARRTGLDPATVAQAHGDAVFVLIGLSIVVWFAVRTVDAAVLIGIELAQGLVGFVQYATHLPALIVGLHMAGACAVWVATLRVLDAVLAGGGRSAQAQPLQGLAGDLGDQLEVLVQVQDGKAGALRGRRDD